MDNCRILDCPGRPIARVMSKPGTQQITIRLDLDDPQDPVRCKLFRHLEFQDTEGKWRACWTEDLRPEPVEIVCVERSR